MERPRGGRFGVADNADALNNATEVGCIHKGAQKATQFAHAAEVLNLDILKRQMFDERLKEIALIITLDKKLNWQLDSSGLWHVSAPQGRVGLQRRLNPVHR